MGLLTDEALAAIRETVNQHYIDHWMLSPDLGVRLLAHIDAQAARIAELQAALVEAGRKQGRVEDLRDRAIAEAAVLRETAGYWTRMALLKVAEYDDADGVCTAMVDDATSNMERDFADSAPLATNAQAVLEAALRWRDELEHIEDAREWAGPDALARAIDAFRAERGGANG